MKPLHLPDFPWDKVAPYAEKAAAHPAGLVDLSVGSPVDPTPEIVQAALAGASDSRGYPLTIGLPATRQACLDWLARRCGVSGLGLDAVIPVNGLKEAIANMALHLGLGPADLVVFPELAYPTYEVGAVLAGSRWIACDDVSTLTETPAIVWLNSPSNPTGRVTSREQLKATVGWCRERGVLVVSDECYLEFVFEGEPAISILHPDISGGDPTGLLAIHSLSKRSNMAGYRTAFLAGDPQVIGQLLAVRKNLGLQLPGPQQVAMQAALGDDTHVVEQVARYAARRTKLKAGLEAAGFEVGDSTASLYLWATRGERCWDTVDWFAERGILVAPGEFYGVAGTEHVRVAFTVTDERLESGVARLVG